MTQDDLKQYYSLYTDCWKLFREYAEKLNADTLQDDDYWRRLSVDADNLAKRYGASTLATHLAFDTICGIEDLAKSMRGQSNGSIKIICHHRNPCLADPDSEGNGGKRR